ncbi:hypothetical protein Pst134EA_025847 [Puccinia striiformis f. sp. tritici]|uniref:hypothetical protein n=1 Tax=Puccinia striiformis f. sp. tritici TaxID=168172 RepID=UPI0020083DA9|nr:hypothetical protein Pst134EA_025847 [Puccinia striiformis f. sp. tritici]KAH9451908.1 hypothetical protein Pst134EA_025847 [Puccinia striiformis f. sp. tritici]
MVSRSRTAFAMLSFLAGLVSANWDPSTGYLLNHRPTAAWLGKNKPSVSSSNIQASECSYNTRLQFPNVQAFAWFEVNHASDGAHASPKNGAYGYEPSSTGKFIEGPPDFSTRQPGHDSKYPGFDPKKLQAWPPSAINNFKGPDQSVKHPKCGRPCEQNRDPGSSPGAYGGYQPAPASAYKPPKTWKPSKGDTCFANGNKPTSTNHPNSNNTGGLATGPKNHKEDSPKSAPQAGMKGKHSSHKAMRLRFRP